MKLKKNIYLPVGSPQLSLKASSRLSSSPSPHPGSDRVVLCQILSTGESGFGRPRTRPSNVGVPKILWTNSRFPELCVAMALGAKLTRVVLCMRRLMQRSGALTRLSMRFAIARLRWGGRCLRFLKCNNSSSSSSRLSLRPLIHHSTCIQHLTQRDLRVEH